MLVILDRQHAGRESKPADRGAVNGQLVEVELVERYLAVASAELARLGHTVVLLRHGEYGERHRQACKLAAATTGKAAYIAAHVNAGGGRYALVEHDARSSLGSGLAMHLAHALARDLAPEVIAGKSIGLQAGARGHSCIDGIYQGRAGFCAALLEPGFIDATAHASLWTSAGLSRVGLSLATALHAWSLQP